KVKEILFAESDAIGKLIDVGGIPFMVIGVMAKKTQNSSYNSRDANRIFIPATTFSSIYGDVHVHNILYTPRDPRESESLADQILGSGRGEGPCPHDYRPHGRFHAGETPCKSGCGRMSEAIINSPPGADALQAHECKM